MADPRVQGIVEFILKEKGLLDASARLRQLEAQVKQTQGVMGGLGKAGEALGSALRTYVAPLAIFNFFRTSALDMLQFQKQLAGTAQMIRALGGDASSEMPRVQAFLGAIQDATGIIDDETLPAFQKLLGITESVPAALEGVALAARIARSGAMEFGEAAQAITDVLAGKLTGAAKSLGVALVDSSGSARDAADVFAELDNRLDKLDLDKQATGVKGLKGAWDNFSDAVGTVFIPVMNGASRVAEAFLNVGTLLFKIIEGGAIAFANLALQIGNVGTGIYGLLTGQGLAGFSKFDDATEELHQQLLDLLSGTEKVDKGLANTTKGLEDAAKRLRGLDDGKDVKDRLAAEKALLDSKIALAEEGSRKRLELELQALETERAEKVKAAGKDLDQIAAVYETYDNKRRKLEQEYTKFHSEEAQKRAQAEEEATAKARASLRGVLEDARKILAERLKGEQKIKDLISGYADETAERVLERWKLERDAQAARWKLERDAQAAALQSEAELLNQSLEMQTEGAWYISDEKVAIVKETLDKIAEAEIKALEDQRDREIAAAEAIGADTAAIRSKWNNAIGVRFKSHQAALADLEKMSTEERAQFWLQYAQVVAGALAGIFGQNKALAIAEAVINTALAVLQTYKTYGMTPWGHAAAALMIAAGLVQIQKIQSANPGTAGKGFDDPVNDRMAYHGGRRWAQDYIEMTSRGFADGLRIGPVPKRLAAATQSITNNNSSSVTHDQSTGQVIHVHGAFIDSDSLRTLGRKLKQVERSDAARFQR